MLTDSLLKPGSAKAAQHGPQLQRPKTAPQRNRDLAQIDGVVGRLEELRNEAERPPEGVGPASPERRAVHGRPQPLVRVHADRVRALPPLEVMPELRADRRPAPACGAHLQPPPPP